MSARHPPLDPASAAMFLDPIARTVGGLQPKRTGPAGGGKSLPAER